MQIPKKYLPTEQEATELEDILSNQEVSMDMDVMDFFLVAGLKTYLSSHPLGRELESKYRKAISQRRRDRKATLPNKRKMLETRLANHLADAYGKDKFGRGFVTIQECLPYLAICSLRKIRYKSVACFNQLMEEYNLETVRMSPRGISEERLFKQYGIKSWYTDKPPEWVQEKCE
ncbi:hypothetical protein KAR91_27195 [Candidatus Pacearchaeota archaeon]|nr:hypothetical protein [Candidatus Pacearchaeota archaeon]